MNGNTAGLVATDAGSSGDLGQHICRAHEALRLFNAAAKAACDIGEHKLQREAEDAAGRLVGLIQTFQAQQAEERERRRETLHGEDSQNAEVTDGTRRGPA